MILFILEKVPESLRGELTRWMLEPKGGIFIGTMSARVREKLWSKIIEDVGPAAGAMMIHSDPDAEWGFHLTVHGSPRRRIVVRDGLQLVEYDHPNRERALTKLKATIPGKLRRELAEKLGLLLPEESPPNSAPEGD